GPARSPRRPTPRSGPAGRARRSVRWSRRAWEASWSARAGGVTLKTLVKRGSDLLADGHARLRRTPLPWLRHAGVGVEAQPQAGGRGPRELRPHRLVGAPAGPDALDEEHDH